MIYLAFCNGPETYPAFLSVSFSSLGCLTVPGSQTPDGSYKTGTGDWSKFRKKVGFDGQFYGERFDNLLPTGFEAAAVASELAKEASLDSLICLRKGSEGPLVTQLQEQLDLEPDAKFGPNNARRS